MINNKYSVSLNRENEFRKASNMKKYLKIFEPIKIGTKTSKNRIEVAPAAPFLSGRDGGMNLEYAAYLNNLAKSGAGIVEIGVSNINTTASGTPIFCVGNPMLIADLSDAAEIIHKHGALACIELVHSKYMRTPAEVVANETTKEQIQELIALYANAAQNCLKAGFDMIMVHGGHGNVPSMFFSEKFNKRKDEYGGSFENRCRFGIELLSAIREKVGDRLAIEYRISADEMLEGYTHVEETLEYAKKIQGLIDMIHISRGLLEKRECLPYLNAPAYFPRAINLEFAKRFKNELTIPVAVVGSFNLELAENAIGNGDVDVVAMVRTVFADPNCVLNAYKEKDYLTRPCVRCNTCIDRTHSKFIRVRCAVNPRLGRELWNPPITVSNSPKKVVVIGGGPAGLEAARTASKMGHKVFLFEKNTELGGMLRYAAAASFKYDMKSYLDWSIRMAESDPNIEIRKNTNATPEMISKEKPDAVFVAIGSEPIIPRFSLSGTEKIAWAGDVDIRDAKTGQSVVIVGAGFTGLETALELAYEGKSVMVIDKIIEKQIGADGIEISMIGLRQLLNENGVKFKCGVMLEDVTKDGAVIRLEDGTMETLICDTVVLSLGVKPDEAAVKQFEQIADTVRVIGDCSLERGGTLYNAVRTAFDNVMEYLS